MRKIIFVSSVLMLSTVASVRASDLACVNIDGYDCGKYGYSNMLDVDVSCSNGWVACPMNTNYRRCDAEADVGDFKFSRAKEESFLRWFENKNQAGKFIVGAKPSANANKCQLAHGYYSTTTYSLKHYHKATTDPNYYAENSAVTCKEKGTHMYKSLTDACDTTSSLEEYTTASAGGSEARPINFTLYGYNYGAALNGSENTVGKVASSSNVPTCADMGYVHKINQCPGDYIVCPSDPNKADDVKAVLCDLEARAGEVKFSLKSGDHNGWLQLNEKGTRKLSSLGDKYKKSELYTILGSDNLPDYSGSFFRVYGSGAETSLTQYQSSAQLSHTHKVKTNALKPSGYSNRKFINGAEGDYHGSVFYKGMLDEYSKKGRTGYVDTTQDTENRPYNYGANIFIYTGLLNVN